jgi:hypothetical protein
MITGYTKERVQGLAKVLDLSRVIELGYLEDHTISIVAKKDLTHCKMPCCG